MLKFKEIQREWLFISELMIVIRDLEADLLEIKPNYGKTITREDLKKFEDWYNTEYAQHPTAKLFWEWHWFEDGAGVAHVHYNKVEANYRKWKLEKQNENA